MNLFKKTLLSLVIALAAGAANAEIIYDTVLAASSATASTVTTSHSVNFQHNITDELKAYDLDLDKIISATLKINLFDHNNGNETFTFTISSGLTSEVIPGQNVNNGSQGALYPISLTTSLADLVADGLLSVTLSASSGEFRFVSSTLEANVQRPALQSDVPEPASIALLGLGLLSIAASRRKFSRK